jgi:hypothetical protein
MDAAFYRKRDGRIVEGQSGPAACGAGEASIFSLARSSGRVNGGHTRAGMDI